MKEIINGSTYSTDDSVPVKFSAEEEDLGGGYTRYSYRVVYYRSEKDDYFLYVNRTTVDRVCSIFDIQEYIVPVGRNWVAKFRRDTPDRYPNKFMSK